ncbi:restriction endonuclease subunit S [Paracidovorax citrulli]
MSLAKYANYKDTGTKWLGLVPTHWQIRRLGYYFNERREKVSDKDFPPLSVTKNGVVPQLDTAAKTDDGDNRKKVCAGDFVINSRSDRKGSAGAAHTDGCVSLISTVLHPNPEMLIEYAHYLLRSQAFQEEYYRYGKGIVADLWSTNYSEMRNIALAVPEPTEQSAIAQFLDRETGKIETLIAEQEKLLALLAEKRQATISHAVTRGLNPDVPMKDSGISWLDKVPRHWEIVGLTKYIDSIVDYRGRTPTKVDDGVFLVTAKNIRDGVIDYDASQEYIGPREYDEVMRRGTPKKGDVLFTTEAPLGQVAIVDREDIALAQRIIKFRANPKRLNNAYLKTWIISRFCQFNLEQLATGSTALGIKGSKIGQVRMCLPPLEEQREIVAFVEEEMAKLDALETTAERAIALLKERRSALITAAVTGKIDVRNTVPEELAA